MTMLDPQSLRERLSYDADTGSLVWISGRLSGRGAGCRTKDGYCYVRIDSKNHYAHRVAWVLHYGENPVNQIDHLDGNRSNNRIANLRLATAAENAQNRVAYRNNKSGLLGVVTTKGGRYIARIKAGNSPQITLGYFSDPFEAHSCYLSAKAKLHAFQPEIRAVK
ncbi:MAG: HNH endonuclease signature motif containing protein [Hyphomicrobium sp.]